MVKVGLLYITHNLAIYLLYRLIKLVKSFKCAHVAFFYKCGCLHYVEVSPLCLKKIALVLKSCQHHTPSLAVEILFSTVLFKLRSQKYLLLN